MFEAYHQLKAWSKDPPQDLKQVDVIRTFKDCFDEFFNAHPKAERIRWRQIPDYFNDEDAPYFKVTNFEMLLEGYFDFIPQSRVEKPDDRDLVNAFTAFEEPMTWDCAPMFEFAFGDRADVTATRKGFHWE